MAARDFVTCTGIKQVSSTKLLFVACSVEDDRVPLHSSRVRGELILSGWILEQKEQGLEASYLVQVDPKGNIPSGTSSIFKISCHSYK